MFGILKVSANVNTLNYYADTVEFMVFAAAILCSMPIFKNVIYIQNKIAKCFINIGLLLMFVMSTVSLAAGTYNPFIYFRF